MKKLLTKILAKVGIHVQSRHLYEVVVTPEHEQRNESKEFVESKERLKADGHYQCWVCSSTENLDAHHFGAEWSLSNLVDFDKLKNFCEEWDPYGYGKLMKNQSITSVDDIRNMLILCKDHHIGVNHSNDDSGTGIHSMTFPAFIAQKLAKNGENPIPQDGQTSDQVIENIDKKEE